MLQVVIPEREFFDSRTNEFVTIKETKLALEHSLVSVSKWEAKWKKPFVGRIAKTYEESIDYIRCMTLTQNVDPRVYWSIPDDVFEKVNSYIDDPMTATWFNSNEKERPSREVITSEIVYYWMIALNIPSEYQKWHFNRLLTLIRVCNVKNAPKKKMSKKEILKRNRELNAARRKELNTPG